MAVAIVLAANLARECKGPGAFSWCSRLPGREVININQISAATPAPTQLNPKKCIGDPQGKKLVQRFMDMVA